MLHANITPDLALAQRLFRQIHDDSVDVPGVTRDAFGAGEQRAHDLVARIGQDLGLEHHVDAAGNLALTLPGRERTARRLMVGSHLDSVRHGGDYDGTVGVLAGLACLSGLASAGWEPAQDITLLVTRAEEAGAWFPVSFPGSRAALGTLPSSALDVRRLDTGRTLAAHMLDGGFAPDAIRAGTAAWLNTDNVEGFLELHIEQGPILEALGVPVGLVTAVPGSRRHRDVRIVGQTNHSGATPRAYRRDAALAAAELTLRLDDAWAEMLTDRCELTCTVCVLETGPGAAFTQIAGAARMEIDLRSPDPAALDQIHGRLVVLAGEVAGRRGVAIDLGPETGSPGSTMDQDMLASLQHAADACGIGAHVMTSGGGHDAVAFAAAGIPAGLVFVRNQNGSHCPEEAMQFEDFATATRLAMHWLLHRSR